MEFNADMNSNPGTHLKKGLEGEMFKVLMILTLVIETVISQNFVLTQVSNFIANFVLKTDRQTDWLNEAPCQSLKTSIYNLQALPFGRNY